MEDRKQEIRPRGFKLTRGEKIFQICNTVFLILLCFVTLYPLYYILVYSFNEGSDSLRGGLYFWPRKFTTYNYEYIFKNGVITQAYSVTILRTIIGTLLGMTVTTLTAYGMSFRELPKRKVFMVMIIIPMLFNSGLIPYYLQLSNLGLINTFWVYVIPGMFNIWNMFVLMKSFMGIPASMRESAILDGAGEMTILLRIILPLSKATLAAIALFTAVGHWNDWYSGAFYVNTQQLTPMATFLQRLFTAESLASVAQSSAMAAQQAFYNQQSQSMTITSVKMAAVVAGTLPILCIYPFVQKYFVKGVMTGGVKG